MKVTILKTNEGTKFVEATQCSNGTRWDADGCFKYCNSADTEFWQKHQVRKLLCIASDLNDECTEETEWWKNRDNFKDSDVEE